ncbi:B-cell receptor CD22-like [Clinocottus analis]|uniref:B-cell receptor CD22-like n=1 Tax=Clinocottus analis TaxID=304258 RepID=UPI0035BFD19D
MYNAPKLPSVSVSPSGEIVEGSSVTLTCSSDANPAASYTWYKGNQTLLQGPEGVCRFTSISSEDRGIYYCKSENPHGSIDSTSLFLNVQYAPKLPSVSVSPSGEIVEGSSVNLTCSSDANPAASYTWYKEDEDSPKASGHIFTITDFRDEHSGSYYCEAQNTRGRSNSTLYLISAAGAWKATVMGTTAAGVLAAALLSVFVLTRKKRAATQSSEPAEPQHSRERDDLHYSSVQFSNSTEDSPYCNITPAQLRRHKTEESVVYAEVKRPEVKRPEVKRPEVKRPEVKRPEVKRPEVKRPEVKRPEVKRPEVKRPEVKRPEVKRPEVKRPEVKRPRSNAPRSNAPRSNAREVSRGGFSCTMNHNLLCRGGLCSLEAV